MWWLLCREVLRLQGRVPRTTDWDVMVDMFIYRDPEEQEKQEEERKATGFGQSWTGAETSWESSAVPTGDDQFAGEGDWAAGQWDGTADQGAAADFSENATNDW
jgi:small subunit ribosomal protein SAe